MAEVAEEKEVPTLVDSLAASLPRNLATTGKRADLFLGNNVLAQVPDLNSFVAGMKILLAPQGVITSNFRTCCA